MATAREQTGITHILDAAIEAPLSRLLESLNGEADLNAHGVRSMESRLLRILRNRLRMQRDLREHPEILQRQIVCPIFLTGAARTGSTKLAKMLAASGDFIHLLCWQGLSLGTISGDRHEDPAPRIGEADEENRRLHEFAPTTRRIHEYSSMEPEEETLIFELILFGPFVGTMVHVPGFVEWYMSHRDPRTETAFFKQSLQYFLWQFHDGDTRPLLLKTPIYHGMEPFIAEQFPDARFVTTNREPVGMMSSSVSLQVEFKKAFSDTDRASTLGPYVLEGLAMGVEGHIAAREQHPEILFLDLPYSQITKDGERAAERVYAYVGMPLSDHARKAMRAWEHDNGQHKQGVHAHALEEYRLTADMVRTRFARQIARFGDCF